MKRLISGLTVLILSGMLLACSSKGGVDETEESTADATDARSGKSGKYGKYGKYGSEGYGRGASSGRGRGLRPGDVGPTEGVLGERVIYFEYDSDDVLPDYQRVVNAHAEYLSSHPESTIVLEGHADERGSSEYNVALGERRALSVARTMRVQGVGESQVRTLSYGEEKPAGPGHDEGAWQQNRRVEIFYPGNP